MKNRLKLAKELYDLHKIQQAIITYKKLAQIYLDEDNKYYYCDFIKTQYDLKTTINEFENYVIGLMFK